MEEIRKKDNEDMNNIKKEKQEQQTN